MAAGDPAQWENLRLELGWVTTPAAPIRLCVQSADRQGCSYAVGRVPFLPLAEHPAFPVAKSSLAA